MTLAPVSGISATSSVEYVPNDMTSQPAGKTRRWDVVDSHSSVGIVVYHTELRALVLVRQFRPAVSFCIYVCGCACTCASLTLRMCEALFVLYVCWAVGLSACTWGCLPVPDTLPTYHHRSACLANRGFITLNHPEHCKRGQISVSHMNAGGSFRQQRLWYK